MKALIAILSITLYLTDPFQVLAIPILDTLEVASVNANAGEIVNVPVKLTDVFGSFLGADQGAGRQLQAVAFQLSWAPASYVSSISVSRSGAAKSLVPFYEYATSYGNTLGYFLNFDENVQPLLGYNNEGAAIAVLSIQVSPLASAGSRIQLSLSPDLSMLSNTAGTFFENVTSGNLSLLSGYINVKKSSSKPVLKILASKRRILEKNGVSKLRVILARKNKTALKVRLAYSGTARNGKDYIKLPSAVVLKPGRTVYILKLRAKRDKLREGVERAVISIKRAKSYSSTMPSSTSVSIID